MMLQSSYLHHFTQCCHIIDFCRNNSLSIFTVFYHNDSILQFWLEVRFMNCWLAMVLFVKGWVRYYFHVARMPVVSVSLLILGSRCANLFAHCQYWNLTALLLFYILVQERWWWWWLWGVCVCGGGLLGIWLVCLINLSHHVNWTWKIKSDFILQEEFNFTLTLI